VLAASRGSGMVFERSYMNWEEGLGVCCWEAPAREDLAALFRKAGTPFERIVAVEENSETSLCP